MSELQKLLERVEKATGADRELDARLYCLEHGFRFSRRYGSDFAIRVDGVPHEVKVSDQSLDKFTASIDAALALVERMKPIGPMVAHELNHSLARDGEDWWNFRIKQYVDEEGEPPIVHWGTHWDGTRAILAALLKALISQSEEKGE